MIFDRDPSIEDVAAVIRAAHAMKELLEDIGLPPYVKTTGLRGLHVVVPLERKEDFDSVRAIARQIAGIIGRSRAGGIYDGPVQEQTGRPRFHRHQSQCVCTDRRCSVCITGSERRAGSRFTGLVRTAQEELPAGRRNPEDYLRPPGKDAGSLEGFPSTRRFDTPLRWSGRAGRLEQMEHRHAA
jgi:hypothetical protein